MSLHDKHDTVSVIQTPGQEQAYRVQTDTPAGVLRSASLTLRANDLHPTNGTFRFETDETVELDETNPFAGYEPRFPNPKASPSSTETPAGPEDTLHVLAALNKIGAVVGVPVEVEEEPQHRLVIVRATGISRELERQISEALKPLPRASFTLSPHEPGASSTPAQSSVSEKYSSSLPPLLRQQFEERLGGAAALQEATDRVLENSASLLARSHALETLAKHFPTEVEVRLGVSDDQLLASLRAKHVAELGRLLVAVQDELKSLIPSGTSSTPLNPDLAGQPWQTRVASVVVLVRETDTLLNTLLSGSYSQSSGEEMLQKLAARIQGLDEMIKRESKGER